MKLYDEESVLLLQLITCRPPPTEAGLRFVALGLCMLMACPSLIALPDQEQRGFQWVKYLSLVLNAVAAPYSSFWWLICLFRLSGWLERNPILKKPPHLPLAGVWKLLVVVSEKCFC